MANNNNNNWASHLARMDAILNAPLFLSTWLTRAINAAPPESITRYFIFFSHPTTSII